MSNCVVGSGGSRLPCSTIAEHSVEGCDHFSHDGDDDDLGFFIGGGEAAWPISARAQQEAKIPRIGIVDNAPMWQTFRQALRELSYVEGQTVNYEYRYS